LNKGIKNTHAMVRKTLELHKWWTHVGNQQSMYKLSSNSNGTKSQKPKANEQTMHEDLSCKMKKTRIWNCQKWKAWQPQIMKLQSLFPNSSQWETIFTSPKP
jgi:hypothetical protein